MKTALLALIVPILPTALRWLQNRGSSISIQKTLFFVLIGTFCFYPYLARADTKIFPANCESSPVPDISGWEVDQTSRIEFRLSDETVAYLGVDIEHKTYRDLNSGEFMKVFSRHIPFIPSRPKQTDERVIEDVVTELYVQKDEEDRLGELEGKMDPFLYVYWRVRENPRNGNDILDGDVDIWFMPSDGSCRFFQNEPVDIQFMTESVGNGTPRNVFVGVIYKFEICKDKNNIDDESRGYKNKNSCPEDEKEVFYHILKVDRRDVAYLAEGGR